MEAGETGAGEEVAAWLQGVLSGTSSILELRKEGLLKAAGPAPRIHTNLLAASEGRKASLRVRRS